MATSYTSLLGLALPVQGELSGTWGDVVNNSITSLVDSAVAGTTTLSTDADVTLTTTTGAANTAREAILLCTGARTVLRNITAPAASKTYTVINATTGGFAVVIRGVGPTAGVSVPAGYSVKVAWNGSDFVQMSVPVSNVSGLGTGVATALAVNVGTAGSPVVNGGALGTPSSGTVTNLTGTASININGTVGATTPAAVSATALSYTTTLTGGTGIVNLGSGQFYKDASGNVGIGNTVIRTNRLAVTATNKVTDNDGTVNLYTSDATATNVGACIGFGGVNSQATSPWVYGTIAGRAESGGAYNGYLQFSTTSVSGLVSEKMRIDSSGNVGIGTSSPAQIVEANKSQDAKTQIKTTNTNAGVSASAGVLFGTSSGDNGYVGANGGAASSALGGANALQITNLSAAPIVLATNSAERMRIDSSGNIGVKGSTPSAWASDKTAIQNVPAASSLWWHDTNKTIAISSNYYFGAAGRTAIATGYASEVQINSNGIYNRVYNTVTAGSVYTTPVVEFVVGSDGNAVLASTTGGLGYGTGSGGTVTQATSKTTSVTLNKPTGQITMNNAALAAGADVSFIFNNTLIGASDNVILTFANNAAGTSFYNVWISYLVSSRVDITLKNISASSRGEALIINFAVIKGATS